MHIEVLISQDKQILLRQLCSVSELTLLLAWRTPSFFHGLNSQEVRQYDLLSLFFANLQLINSDPDDRHFLRAGVFNGASLVLSKRTDLSCPSFHQLWFASGFEGHSAASSAKAGHWVKSSEIVGIVLNWAMRPRIKQCFSIPLPFSFFASSSFSSRLSFLAFPPFSRSVGGADATPVSLEPDQKPLGRTVTEVFSLGTFAKKSS